jgi:hypothetical protein
VSIDVATGSTIGGDVVVITGTYLTGVTSVTFGGDAADFVIDSSTQITATTPAHAAGAVDVAVTAPTGSDVLEGAFTFETPLIDLVAELGSTLLYMWQVPASGDARITIDGSNNVSQLNEWKAGSANFTQSTAGNRPAYHATGGPNNAPYIELQDTARWLRATISISAANRTGLYIMQALPNVAATRFCAGLCDGTSNPILRPYTDGSKFRGYANFTGGAQDPLVTSPTLNTSWHLFAQRPLASGALYQIDGVTTTPDLTGTDTLTAISRALIGRDAATFSGGSVAMMVAVSDASADVDDLIRAYIAQEYAL